MAESLQRRGREEQAFGHEPAFPRRQRAARAGVGPSSPRGPGREGSRTVAPARPSDAATIAIAQLVALQPRGPTAVASALLLGAAALGGARVPGGDLPEGNSSIGLDRLAGSWLHVVETIATRAAVLGPLTVPGFSREAMDAFVIVVGVQAVLIHANARLRLGPLRHAWATPRWHPWHHASDHAALDRNDAVTFPVIGPLSGSAIRGLGGRMPRACGRHGETVPDGFVAQPAWPLRRRPRGG